MLIRCGTDLVAVERFAALDSERLERRLERVCTERELALRHERHERPEHWAGIFAAKEAFFKALGTGLGLVGGPGLQDVEILYSKRGAPYYSWTRELDRLLAQGLLELPPCRMAESSLSISHEAGLASAICVLVLEELPEEVEVESEKIRG
ncbi:MAG: 4'-phosphopantetheinyl transferase superfamily protein [Eubacteriales bacterium]|nr:4'-phosphopantetheinyl transferase superfamily protein [Eubacteriales bacterium]